ncbi:hypothetical protein [Streptodolium elevatio]|uniref:Pycsar effector protein domain-containing protein n=1 Tax=Streptodolium elevatio TaxID=3157996 RepID=A0ABV3DTE3_9ACTN
MTAPTLTTPGTDEPEPARPAAPRADLAAAVYADWRTVAAAIDVLDLRGSSWSYQDVVDLAAAERPSIVSRTVVGWVDRLVRAGYVERASVYDRHVYAVKSAGWQARAAIEASLRPAAAGPGETAPDPARQAADRDAADAGRLRARIASAEGNIRAADAKASVLLAGLGFVAGPMLALGGAAAVVVAAALLVPAVLLGLVLLPRTAGLRDLLPGASARDVIDAVADADQPVRLASELSVLNGIAVRKYALIRAALIAMTFVVPACAAACLAS